MNSETRDCPCGDRVTVNLDDVGGSLLAHYRTRTHRLWSESQQAAALHALPILPPHVDRADCPCGTRDQWFGQSRVVIHATTDPRAWRDASSNWIEGYEPSAALSAQLDAAKEATADGTRLTGRAACSCTHLAYHHFSVLNGTRWPCGAYRCTCPDYGVRAGSPAQTAEPAHRAPTHG